MNSERMHNKLTRGRMGLFENHLINAKQGNVIWFRVKETDYKAENLGLIPGSGRTPGEGNGNPLQYSCLQNPMDRGAW